MEDQQFCLKWSNHHSNMMDIFGRLLTNEVLCDVTLACDGFSFKAHKLVLSASSAFFQNLFLENPCTHPVIILPDLKYMDMKALVDFMYNGQVNVSESQLPKLLKVAENLRIKGLSDCRLQNSAGRSDNPESSPDTSFLKMDSSELSEQPKKQFDKDSDSNSCNIEFQEQSELFNPDTCTDNQEPTISNHQSSDGQNSDIGTTEPEVQISQQATDGSDLTSMSDTEIEMEPSKMMEQSMTTDHVFKSQSLDSDQVLTKETLQNEIEGSISSDDCTNLPDSSDNSKEVLAPAVCFSQNPCTSKDDRMATESTSNDHISFTDTASSVKEEFVISKEKSICVAGPSTIVFETSTSQSQYSQGTMHSVWDVDMMKNGAKRGRRPGSRLCVLCKHIFSSESELEKHMENHKRDSSSNISESKQFPEEIESSDSQVISEKNLVRLPVSCATCNCVLNTMSDAQSHLSMNPNCRTSQFKCLLCPKLFIWPATLIKHFREQHQGPGGTARVTQRLWFFCDICKKPLLSKHALCLHRSKFHGFSTQSLGSDSTGMPGHKRPSLTASHVLIKSTKRRCAVCSRYHIQRRSTLECGKCRVALCSDGKRNCFEEYHLSMGIFYLNE